MARSIGKYAIIRSNLVTRDQVLGQLDGWRSRAFEPEPFFVADDSLDFDMLWHWSSSLAPLSMLQIQDHVTIEHVSQGSRSIPSQFADLFRQHSTGADNFLLKLTAIESNRHRSPKQINDPSIGDEDCAFGVGWAVSRDNQDGHYFCRLSMGKRSIGWTDRKHRQQFFARCINAIGLERQVTAQIEKDVLRFASKPPWKLAMTLADNELGDNAQSIDICGFSGPDAVLEAITMLCDAIAREFIDSELSLRLTDKQYASIWPTLNEGGEGWYVCPTGKLTNCTLSHANRKSNQSHGADLIPLIAVFSKPIQRVVSASAVIGPDGLRFELGVPKEKASSLMVAAEWLGLGDCEFDVILPGVEREPW